jgi:3-hydroxy-9,10-secoandrosta-1,3,5(10)-triene-9,17-dione monooxygenase reductase component
MQNLDTLDPKVLRVAFGSFATGVTVITTKGQDGKDYGLTANSFSSVSLEPPLLLWSLDNKAKCFDAFQQAEYFAVHILAADQQDLSNKFASKEKFVGLEVERGPGEIPLLVDSVTRFICKSTYKYGGGDHVIHVGEVVAFSENDLEPLLFHNGKYAKLG